MSFPIDLYVNSSPANKVDKDIELRYNSGGTLKEATSIIDPTFIIEAGETLFLSQHINYLYVPMFQRYYYILDIVSTYNQLYEIKCHVDVLMSYAAQIKEQTAIVARQEGQYNLMLDDGSFMAYQNPRIITKTFSNTTPFETQEFVLVVAGG